MQMDLAVVCEDAFINPRGRLTVEGVSHHFIVPAVPVRLESFVLAGELRFERSERGHEQVIQSLLLDPESRLLTSREEVLKMEANSDALERVAFLILPFQDVYCSSAGDYRFEIYHQGELLDIVPFGVHVDSSVSFESEPFLSQE